VQQLRESADFCAKLKRDNTDFILHHFGLPEDNCQFIHGICFATSMSKETLPSIQNVLQADACHLNFGKYTLYSSYATSADSGCIPVAFAILFGNEDADGWTRFWTFAKATHLSLATDDKITIITDQDKGSASAIAQVLPHVGNFHCSFHRRMNIHKNCKNRTKKECKAIQAFDSLISAKNIDDLRERKEFFYPCIDDEDKIYLTKLRDDQQYPAARCALGPHIYMYGRTSSASVESMNAANKSVCHRTSIDLVNATILLLQLEKKRFNEQKEKAWSDDNGRLTPKGRILSNECSLSVPNHRDYAITRSEHDTFHEYKVCIALLNIYLRNKLMTLIFQYSSHSGTRQP